MDIIKTNLIHNQGNVNLPTDGKILSTADVDIDTLKELLGLTTDRVYNRDYFNPYQIDRVRQTVGQKQVWFNNTGAASGTVPGDREIAGGFQLWKAERPMRVRGMKLYLFQNSTTTWGGIRFHASPWLLRVDANSGRRNMPHRPFTNNYNWNWQTVDQMCKQSGQNEIGGKDTLANAGAGSVYELTYMFDQAIDIDPRDPRQERFALLMAGEVFYPGAAGDAGHARVTNPGTCFYAEDGVIPAYWYGNAATNTFTYAIKQAMTMATTTSIPAGVDGTGPNGGYQYANDLVLTGPFWDSTNFSYGYNKVAGLDHGLLNAKVSLVCERI